MEPSLSSTSFEIPALFHAGLQAKTVGISKLVDDEAGSILWTKKSYLLTRDNTFFRPWVFYRTGGGWKHSFTIERRSRWSRTFGQFNFKSQLASSLCLHWKQILSRNVRTNFQFLWDNFGQVSCCFTSYDSWTTYV